MLLVDAPGSRTGIFLDRERRRGPRFRAARRARDGEYRLRWQLRLDADAGAAHAHRTHVFGAFRVPSRQRVAGGFAISSFAEGERAGRAIEISLRTLDALKQRGLSAEALDSARNYLLGQYPLGFETSADWAAAMGELALFALPDSYIDDFGPALVRVDARQAAQVVAQAFPDSQDLAVVLIGDAGRLRRQAARFGPLTERALAAPEFG